MPTTAARSLVSTQPPPPSWVGAVELEAAEVGVGLGVGVEEVEVEVEVDMGVAREAMHRGVPWPPMPPPP